MSKLGIYVQVPFCQTKCTYCNFHTGVVSTARFAPYVEAVYIGGGTPSLLEPPHLQNILDTIRKSFAADFVEVTLEADPETIEAEKANAWVQTGINRVSFGVQSFSDK